MPGSIFTKLECDADVILIPPLFSLFRVERFVGQCDESAVLDGEGNVEVTIGGVEEGRESRIHFELFRKTAAMRQYESDGYISMGSPMYRVVTIDEDLVGGIV